MREWIACAVLLLSISSPASAQQVCFPSAKGVGGSSPAPDWWSPGAQPFGSTTTSFLEDPRWRGALTHDVLEYERFQVVVDTVGRTKYLVMSWQVRADLSDVGDRLYFGLWDDASNTGNVYRLTRNQAAQTNVEGATQANGAFGGRVFSGTGTLDNVAWSTSPDVVPPPLPEWLTRDARVDVTCAMPPTHGCDRWAFRVRAPLSAAVDTAAEAPAGLKLTGTSFHFWYEIQDSGTIGTASYAFPQNIANAAEGGIPPIVIPAPITWQAATTGSGTGCESDVSLRASNVWVNGASGTVLSMSNNEFHARPVNETATNLMNESIVASFAVADWGSLSPGSPGWGTVCSSSMMSSSITPGSRFDLRCVWAGFDACPYRPEGDPCGPSAGTRSPHQCILVKLENRGGTFNTLLFSPSSVLRNMDFDVNSVLRREAIVDTRGLAPMANGKSERDVLLHVQTRNMPRRVPHLAASDPASANVPSTFATGPALDLDTLRVREIAALRARFEKLQLPSQGAIDVKSSARIQRALSEGQITLDQVEALMPTYTVFVWHDTGRTLTTREGTTAILEPQSAFGLFLAHDGELEGWEHRFEGAEELAFGLYRIKTKADGLTKVSATIAPKGELPPAGNPYAVNCSRCDVAPRSADPGAAIFASLAFVAFVLFRIRRRRGVS